MAIPCAAAATSEWIGGIVATTFNAWAGIDPKMVDPRTEIASDAKSLWKLHLIVTNPFFRGLLCCNT